MRLRARVHHFLAALMLACVLAGCASSTPAATQAPAPLPSRSAQGASLWTTGELAYPEEPLVSPLKDAGERSFPHRDLRLPLPGLQLADASARYALLTDRASQRLYLADLRTGRAHRLLVAPVTLRHAPSAIWAHARAVLRKQIGARFTPTRILSAQVSGRRVIWQEALCITTGGFAVEAWALYAADVTRGMKLGHARLLALAQPQSVLEERSAVYWPAEDQTLHYSLRGERLLLIRGAGRREVAEIVDLTNGRRRVLLEPPRSLWDVEGDLWGGRAVVCCLTGEDSARLVSYDLADRGLPCGVAELPFSRFSSDLRGFALGPGGRLAWAKWYTPRTSTQADDPEDAEAVYLLSPDGTIECLAPRGGEPVFVGSTVLWVGLTGDRFWLGGADLTERERFTVAEGRRVRSWSVAGGGHVAVVLVRPSDRRSSTLRVFEVR